MAPSRSTPPTRFPWWGLLALAGAGFITILSEALPAGLLPGIAADLGISVAQAGQLVTLYALGSLMAAIPLVRATQAWRRRPLLLLAIGGFSVVNLVTALSTSYALTLAARFGAGVFAGLLWALLAGHASRMVPAAWQGRAIAVAMVGTPLALSLGIPAGTLLGAAVGWRWAFGVMSLLSVLLFAWVRLGLPDFAGRAGGDGPGVVQALRLPGLRPILALTLLYVLAHNLLYTYVAPWLAHLQAGVRVDSALLAFGVAALGGIWLTGMLVDRWLQPLVWASIALFAAAALVAGLMGQSAVVLLACIACWGLAFGGTATLFQTASARAAGEAGDLAQSMLVTVWNAGMAGGGLLGALLLPRYGAGALPWAVLVLLVLTCLAAAGMPGAGRAAPPLKAGTRTVPPSP
ncbi:MFS transporter [Xylophilus rhododendri]|uniref:MFS transporter n=1 Tax=Xylophilus rhododendri TaxID=2697032 RepID=UPI001E5CD8AB|nr:MFS transporter [Xylophilus rhododendri]